MDSLFYIDSLAKVMIFPIVFIGLVVALFAKQYMKGDSGYGRFFFTLPLIIVSTIITVSTNNIFLFLTFWLLSNAILVLMITHKPNWKLAVASRKLAAKNFLIGFCHLSLGLVLLSYQAGQTSIQSILAFEYENQTKLVISLLLILVATALIVTFWKLIQSNVKNMLACSKIGQIGFMFAQCGLGLFPATVAHLFSHGRFKSYLFLKSGSAAQEKKFNLKYPPKLTSFASAVRKILIDLEKDLNLAKLKLDLKASQKSNSKWRIGKMGRNFSDYKNKILQKLFNNNWIHIFV